MWVNVVNMSYSSNKNGVLLLIRVKLYPLQGFPCLCPSMMTPYLIRNDFLSSNKLGIFFSVGYSSVHHSEKLSYISRNGVNIF